MNEKGNILQELMARNFFAASSTRVAAELGINGKMVFTRLAQGTAGEKAIDRLWEHYYIGRTKGVRGMKKNGSFFPKVVFLFRFGEGARKLTDFCLSVLCRSSVGHRSVERIIFSPH